MKMTKEQLAARLSGRQYGDEITREEEQTAKENNLVVIFGASDDLCEMRGAIYDEFDCYGGGDIECEEYPEKLRAFWCPESGGSWGYETNLPYVTFNIYEDDELYCVGIVVDLQECRAQNSSIKTTVWMCGKNKDEQVGIFCCECGYFVPWFYDYYYDVNDLKNDYMYCPHCGRKAEGSNTP